MAIEHPFEDRGHVIPRGDVYLQTGIYDLAASHAGSLGIPLTVINVPAPTK